MGLGLLESRVKISIKVKHEIQATSHLNQGEVTQDDKDEDSQAHDDDFDFVDELESDKIVYGYQYV